MQKIIDRRSKALGGQSNDRRESRITGIAWHYTAVAREQNAFITGHENYWRNTKGWRRGGYHYYIDSKGNIYQNYNLTTVSNGVGGHNSSLVHISVEANSASNYSNAQVKARKDLTLYLMKRLNLSASTVRQHKEFSGQSTACAGYSKSQMNAFRKELSGGKASKPSTGGSKPSNGKLAVDGYWGKATTRKLQQALGTPVDGIISKPSVVVKALQKLVGSRQDGYLGKDTYRKLQAYLGTPVDGILSKPSTMVKEMQKRLNAGTFAKGKSNTSNAKPSSGKINVDGHWGKATTRKLQQAFGTPVDGIISKPSVVVKALQKLIGSRQDGYLGKDTYRKLQAYLGTPVDGILSKPSTMVKEMQRRLNAGTFVKSDAKKPTSSKKSASAVANDIIRLGGSKSGWGSGDTRKNKLKKAGYNPKEVQNIINKRL